MKKILFLATSVCIASAVFSQVKLGVQVSANFTSATLKSTSIKDLKQTGLPGFEAGIVSSFSLGGMFTIKPAITYNQKSVKITGIEQHNNQQMNGSTTVNLNYLELPLNLVYNIRLAGTRLYFGAGPSVGYGIGGLTKTTTSYNNGSSTQTETEEVETFKEGDNGADFKKFAFNGNVMAGLEFKKGLFINVAANMGLNNLQDAETSFKNYGARLTIGYYFLGKKS